MNKLRAKLARCPFCYETPILMCADIVFCEKCKISLPKELWNTRPTNLVELDEEELYQTIWVGVLHEILNDLTPYKPKEACRHIAKAITKAYEEGKLLRDR